MIKIDIDTRCWQIPKEEAFLGVESDDKVKILQFELSKNEFCDGLNFTDCNCFINYKNEGNDTIPYGITDMALQEDGTVTFTWEVSRGATIFKGNTFAILCAKKVRDDGTITNEWNSKIGSFKVSKGLEPLSLITEVPEIDIISQLLSVAQQTNANAQTNIDKSSSLLEKAEGLAEGLGYLKDDVDELKGDLVDYMFGSDTQLIPNKYVDGNNGAIGNINGWTLAIKKVLPNTKCTFRWDDDVPYIAQYAIYSDNPLTNIDSYISGSNMTVFEINTPGELPFYYLAVCLNTARNSLDITCDKYDGLIPALNDINYRLNDINYQLNDSWKNKKILWLGTSIPEGNTQPANGYPNILGELLGCIMTNNSIGASKIRKGYEPYVTTINPCGISHISDMRNLCQTVAEKQYNIEHWEDICNERGVEYTPISESDAQFYLATSYENLLDPYISNDNIYDAIVINHGFNDHIEDFNTNPTDPYNTYYFKGAMNFIIRRIKEKSPLTKIVIFGHYQHRNDLLFDSVFSEIAKKWNVFYFPLWEYLGWSSEVITANKRVNASGVWESISDTNMSIKDQWIFDGVHPKGVAKDRIAEVSLPLFTSKIN